MTTAPLDRVFLHVMAGYLDRVMPEGPPVEPLLHALAIHTAGLLAIKARDEELAPAEMEAALTAHTALVRDKMAEILRWFATRGPQL